MILTRVTVGERASSESRVASRTESEEGKGERKGRGRGAEEQTGLCTWNRPSMSDAGPTSAASLRQRPTTQTTLNGSSSHGARLEGTTLDGSPNSNASRTATPLDVWTPSSRPASTDKSTARPLEAGSAQPSASGNVTGSPRDPSKPASHVRTAAIVPSGQGQFQTVSGAGTTTSTREPLCADTG